MPLAIIGAEYNIALHEIESKLKSEKSNQDAVIRTRSITNLKKKTNRIISSLNSFHMFSVNRSRHHEANLVFNRGVWGRKAGLKHYTLINFSFDKNKKDNISSDDSGSDFSDDQRNDNDISFSSRARRNAIIPHSMPSIISVLKDKSTQGPLNPPDIDHADTRQSKKSAVENSESLAGLPFFHTLETYSLFIPLEHAYS
jgi:hypothetical protein